MINHYWFSYIYYIYSILQCICHGYHIILVFHSWFHFHLNLVMSSICFHLGHLWHNLLMRYMNYHQSWLLRLSHCTSIHTFPFLLLYCCLYCTHNRLNKNTLVLDNWLRTMIIILVYFDIQIRTRMHHISTCTPNPIWIESSKWVTVTHGWIYNLLITNNLLNHHVLYLFLHILFIL